jgi:hypothetical protein
MGEEGGIRAKSGVGRARKFKYRVSQGLGSDVEARDRHQHWYHRTHQCCHSLCEVFRVKNRGLGAGGLQVLHRVWSSL